ncbi:c-type cytochrome [Sediminibacterium ginsengisoli]|uniref:Cytochrome c n=1 Tax=Sediminibacterium ginsengisoli TaxID=413434 RepID=A0A1T4RGK4_9BACT|nr:c-type cytochrome [Sediminibacterium ginsengisoli]SKA15144.1 Cytochrome c [Sediminibacterium ginsengisoli]
MKKVFKALLLIAAAFIVLAGLAAGYVAIFLPNVGKAPELKVERTPERIERGKYLATSVAVCVDCHSTRDWSQFAGPMVSGTEGKGGDRFGKEMGFPGVFYARNITPYSLSKWTDGEIFRAITSGVDKDNKALFPLMPYSHYGAVDQEDIYSIIAYLRSMPAITNDVPKSEADFPVNLIMKTMPSKPAFTTKPKTEDSVAYGKYLVTMAGCVDCHSKESKGAVIAGTEYGGGREFALPGGIVRAPNLTVHSTGMGSMTREQFIQRFKLYQDSSYRSPLLQPTDFNTPMPWMMYSRMTESDLASIYKFLQTVQPIDNRVQKFTPRKS